MTDSFLLVYGGRLLASGTSAELREMVSELPREVTLVGSGAAHLAGRLADQPWVDSVRLSEDRETLRVTARRVHLLCENLSQWIAADDLQIQRMVGSDDGLAALFDILTRRHRGFSK